MSIRIKGMEMPQDGVYWCEIGVAGEIATITFHGEDRKSFHLASIPPHGRLIDADALHKLFEDQWHYLQVLDWNENPTAEANQSGINWCINTMHDSAPTIIPAEEGE